MAADAYTGREIAGQFKILEKIGAGGMGAVYKAEQPEMRRFVAIKILHPKYLSRPDLVSRFRREARAMSHLSHPNTARVFLYGQLDDGACYFVMEYLAGKNLAQTVRAEGPMDPARAIHILAQSCGALEEAHRQGIVHRDLKPENIFLTNQGGIADFPKVLDFGLAKVTEREMRPGSLILTQEGMVFGTPEFMSPEQARGERLDGRSDIYSLGVILYELLTGKLPFDAKQPMEYIQKHIKEAPKPLSERTPDRSFPIGLWEVIARSLAKRPDDRFATANDFAQALRAVIERPQTAVPYHGSEAHTLDAPAHQVMGGQASYGQPGAYAPAYGAATPQPGGFAQPTGGYGAQQPNGFAQQPNGFAQQPNGFAQATHGAPGYGTPPQQPAYAPSGASNLQAPSGAHAPVVHAAATGPSPVAEGAMPKLAWVALIAGAVLAIFGMLSLGVAAFFLLR